MSLFAIETRNKNVICFHQLSSDVGDVRDVMGQCYVAAAAWSVDHSVHASAQAKPACSALPCVYVCMYVCMYVYIFNKEKHALILSVRCLKTLVLFGDAMSIQ